MRRAWENRRARFLARRHSDGLLGIGLTPLELVHSIVLDVPVAEIATNVP